MVDYSFGELKHPVGQVVLRLLADLISQLSADALNGLQSAFRPIVHPVTFHMLNQYAAFMSKPTGALQDSGGLAKQLDQIIASWTYSGMPSKVQVSLLLSDV